MGVNPQGECLMEYLGGNKPTFAIRNRKEITDLTVETDNMGDLVSQLECI